MQVWHQLFVTGSLQLVYVAGRLSLVACPVWWKDMGVSFERWLVLGLSCRLGLSIGRRWCSMMVCCPYASLLTRDL